MFLQEYQQKISGHVFWSFVFFTFILLFPIAAELTSGFIKNFVKVTWLFFVVLALIAQNWKQLFTKANVFTHQLIVYSCICFIFSINSIRPVVFGENENLDSYVFYTGFYFILPFFTLFMLKNTEVNLESFRKLLPFIRWSVILVFSILSILSICGIFLPTSLLFVCALQGFVIYDFINTKKLKTSSTFAVIVTVCLIVTYDSRSTLLLFYFCLICGALLLNNSYNAVRKIFFSLVTLVASILIFRGGEFLWFFSDLVKIFIGLSYIANLETVAQTGKTLDLDRWLHIVVSFNEIKLNKLDLFFGNGLNSASYELGPALKSNYEKIFPHLDFEKELGNVHNIATFGISKIIFENGLLIVLLFFMYTFLLTLNWYKSYGAMVTIFLLILFSAFLAKLYNNDYTREILFFVFICPGGLLQITGMYFKRSSVQKVQER